MELLPAVLKRDRFVVGAGLAITVALAWCYTVYEARRMDVTGVCACLGMKMGGPELSSWTAASLLPLFGMWAVMMVAMMLPSAAPMILLHAMVSRRKAPERGGRRALLFALAYAAAC